MAPGPDARSLADAKERLGLRVSVCLPARNEALTVGGIVAVVAGTLAGGGGLGRRGGGLAHPPQGGTRGGAGLVRVGEGGGGELGLLLEVAARCGVEAIAEQDLGGREHRNRPLDELGEQALQVLLTGLRRAGVAPVDGTTRRGRNDDGT